MAKITEEKSITYGEVRAVAANLSKFNGYEGLANQMDFLDNIDQIINAAKKFDSFEETTKTANGLEELKAMSEKAMSLNGKKEEELTAEDWATRNEFLIAQSKFNDKVEKAIKDFSERKPDISFKTFPEDEMQKFLFGIDRFSKEIAEDGKTISIKRKQNEDLPLYVKSLLKKYFTK